MLPLLFAAALATASPQAVPPLPDLALATFPPAARETLSRAHKAATAKPTDADAAGDLGRWLHAWELWEAAHQTYGRAHALAASRFDWVYLDAVVLQRLARHDEAAVLLRRAVALKGDYLPARLKLAEAVFESGDLAESRKLFDTLLKEPLAQPAAHVGLGRIAAQEGKPQAAIEHFERAVAAFPELGAAYYGLARAYRALGRSEDAARALEQHRRYGARWPGMDDPVLGSVTGLREDPRAVLKRGVRFAETGEIDKAIADHEAALLRDPSLLNAHANLLSLYGRVKDFAKAEQHYRAALEAGFAPADLHYDYGVIMAHAGELDRGGGGLPPGDCREPAACASAQQPRRAARAPRRGGGGRRVPSGDRGATDVSARPVQSRPDAAGAQSSRGGARRVREAA